MSAHDITSLDQLQSLYREPSDVVKAKKGATITGATAKFIADSTFLCLATANEDGGCDVSPRGGPAGQLKVMDDGRTVVLPDLSGNNLIDSLTNIVSNPQAGLLVMVPGSDETLRIDGSAKLTTDPELLGLWSEELRTPKIAVVLTVESVFLHCAKAFRRGGVWDPATWPTTADTVAPGIFNDTAGTDMDPHVIRQFLEQGYEADLTAERISAD